MRFKKRSEINKGDGKEALMMKKEEIALEELPKRAQTLWEKHGTSIIRELMIANVDFSYRSYFDKEDFLIDQELTGLHYEGILFDHVRYREDGYSRIKSKWLKCTYLAPQSLHEIVCRCHWSLLPISITNRRGKVCYYYYTTKITHPSQGGKQYAVVHQSIILTSGDGRLLHKYPIDEFLIDRYGKRENKSANEIRNYELQYLPQGFSLPTRKIKLVNRCLYYNFRKELWTGEQYSDWFITDRGIYSYANYPCFPDSSNTEVTLEELKSMFSSEVGNAIAVLLAFTCFSMLKRLFPSYPRLTKESSYLTAKKCISDIISINIQSDPPELAEILADRCCGYFERNAAPIYSGIIIEKKAKANTVLGVNEFESKILQHACVLWVNRVPAKDLLQDSRILDIHICSQDLPTDLDDLCDRVVKKISDGMSLWSTKIYEKICAKDWEEAGECALSMLGRLQGFACQFMLDFSPIDFSKENEKIHKKLMRQYTMNEKAEQPSDKAGDDFSKNILDYIIRLIQRVIELETRNPDRNDYIESVYELVKDLEYNKKQILKIHSENVARYSLNNIYKERLSLLGKDERFCALDKKMQKKIACLSAAFSIFAVIVTDQAENLEDEIILPKKKKGWVIVGEAMAGSSILDKKAGSGDLQYDRRSNELTDYVDKTLIKMNLDVKSAGEILEDYVRGLILQNKCARIRGERSNAPNVILWYIPDPEPGTLLLPFQTYFEDIGKLFDLSQTTKLQFERDLEEGGYIYTAPREKQVRRNFDLKVSHETSRIPVLKIKVEKFSSSFHKDSTIQAAIQRMEGDRTPYRSKTKKSVSKHVKK